MSQQELASRVGVSRQWIVGLEHGRFRAFEIVLRTLAALSLAIEVVEDDPLAPGDPTVDLDALLSRYQGPV